MAMYNSDYRDEDEFSDSSCIITHNHPLLLTATTTTTTTTPLRPLGPA